MERVLVIVNAERPSEDLFSITEEIKANGYNVSICCSKLTSEKTEKVKPDFHMEETLCLENYSGVIFMDDGGDEKKAIEIAEEANKSGIAIGGYGVGVHILNEAKLLDDKYVSAMSPIELSDKAKKVNSPSVRCENIVTSSGECADGFVVVFIDALGGEIKRIVKGKEEADIPSKSAMVISELNKWTEYWHLAQKLYEKGVGLIVVPWQNIDVKKATINNFLVLSPAFNPKVKKISAELSIPKRCWFKQTNIGKNATIQAIKNLESIGVRNVNSSSVLSLTSDKIASANVLSVFIEQGNPKAFNKQQLDQAVELLFEEGCRWIKPIDDSLGRKVMRVIGHRTTCILSRRHLASVKHMILTKNQLKKALNNVYKKDFMVQDNLGEIILGDRSFELRFFMRRTASGWKSSCEIARSGQLLSNPQDYSRGQILKACTAANLMSMLYEGNWSEKLAEARELSEKACLLVQAQLDRPTDLSELCVDITLNSGEPRIIEINGIPGLVSADEAYSNPNKLHAFASLYRLNPVVYAPMLEDEWKRSRTDMADSLSEGPWGDGFCDVVRAELAYEKIWPQPDGKIAMHIPHEDSLVKLTIDEAIEELKAEAVFALDQFKEHEYKENIKQFKKMILMKSIHRLLVLREYKKNSCQEQIVHVALKMTGPFHNTNEVGMGLDAPMPWEQAELTDYDPYKQQINRARRHPEYGIGSIMFLGDWEKTRVNLDQFRNPYSIETLKKLIDEGSPYPFSRMNWG